MFFANYMAWMIGLEEISPIGRLLAFYLVYFAKPLTFEPATSADPCWKVDLDRTLTWIGCTEDELSLAVEELRARGVDPLTVSDRQILFTPPTLDDPDQFTAPNPKNEYPLSIYVIGATPHLNKIGISKYVQYRLHNLQAANPEQILRVHWSFEGPATVIRKVERQVHQELADVALRNEWFAVGIDHAIDAVKRVLRKNGISA